MPVDLNPEPRSILFVPADRPELAVKAAGGDADAICLDLEDGVAHLSRPVARQQLEACVSLVVDAGKPVLVRINSEQVEIKQDIDALPSGVAALVVAKASGQDQICMIENLLQERTGSAKLPLIAMIEDIEGLDAFALLRRRDVTSLGGITIGSEDLAAQFECAPDGRAMEFAFYRLLESARRLQVPLFGFPGSIAEFRDLDRFEKYACLGSGMGAVGAFCIHPHQVAVLNRVFYPDREQVAWAQRVVEALDKATAEGLGAVAVDGRMVDKPVAERARCILLRSNSRMA